MAPVVDPLASPERRVAVAARLSWWTVLLVVAGTLAWRVLINAYAASLVAPGTVAAPTWVNLWFRYDAQVYAQIATGGYHSPAFTPAEVACYSRFPPMLPLVTRGLSAMTGMAPAWSATVINLVASAVASVAMVRWVALASGSLWTAWWALAFLNGFPTAFFCGTSYSEGLYTMWAIVALLGLRSRRWALAGLGGAGAVLTRLLGVSLLPAFAWEAWLVWREPGRPPRAAWWLALPGAALLGLLLFHWVTFGSPFNPVAAYTRWPLAMVPKYPFYDIWDDLQTIVTAWLDGGVPEWLMLRVGWDGLLSLGTLALIGWGSRKGWLTVAEGLAGFTYITVFSAYAWNFSSSRYLAALPVLPLVLARLPLWLRLPLFAGSVWLLAYFVRMFVWSQTAF